MTRKRAGEYNRKRHQRWRPGSQMQKPWRGVPLKMKINPMHQRSSVCSPLPALKAARLANLQAAHRCMARTRSGNPCQSPAAEGKARCRMHGGASGSGSPRGERTGSYCDGAWTKEAVESRQAIATLV